MLKINAKLGGKNWELPVIQDSTFTPITGPFMVFGIDVMHPSSTRWISSYYYIITMQQEDLFMHSVNMATTPRDMLIEALHPGIFGRNEDLETFITKATRYFDASGITKTMRSILVVGLLEKSLRDKYEDTEEDDKCKSFEERLRKAFGRHRTLIQEMELAINFRRRSEDTESYVKKIDIIVDNLLRFKWDRETLKRNF